MVLDLPNTLTLARAVAVAPVVACVFLPGPVAAWIALVLFVLAALTDWLDGYLARRMNRVSAFGRFLDPVADKLLVIGVLVALCAEDRLGIAAEIAALAIILREVTVASLREFLAERHVVLPVSRLAKIKTTAELGALVVLLAVPVMAALDWLAPLGEGLLILAALLAVLTGTLYVRASWPHLMGRSG